MCGGAPVFRERATATGCGSCPYRWDAYPGRASSLFRSPGVSAPAGASDRAIYACSRLTMAIGAAITGLGAAVGLSAWLGFVLGGLFLGDPTTGSSLGGRPAGASEPQCCGR